MTIFSLAKAARNAWARLDIERNRRQRREFLPVRRDVLAVETTSVCNLSCRFCAYSKRTSAKVTMPDERFFDCIEQATALGYRRFQMTPCTGDVFMDRGLFTKLDFLDAHRAVEGYEFVTNLTIPSTDDVRRLVRLEKLRELTVSVYGHDVESFTAITRSTEKVYRRLVDNLEALLALRPEWRCRVEIGFRSTRYGGWRADSELGAALRRLKRAGARVRTSRLYNNWGGAITNEDVRGLDIEIASADSTYKSGACLLLFGPQVTASGVVNGCACRDFDATLRIGDLKTAPLSEILSPRNREWLRIVNDQQEGNFPEICRGCDFYRSIYHRRWSDRRRGAPYRSLEEFLADEAPAPNGPPAPGAER